ncbi:hypothetical protein PCE1_003512 [Barthelona sp. PCE]
MSNLPFTSRGRTAVADGVRPMTSNRSAGYTSSNNIKKRGISGISLEKAKDESPEYKVRELELQIEKDVQQSACEAAEGNYEEALSLARKASYAERQASSMRRAAGLSEPQNIDVFFTTTLQLANALELNEIYSEAIETYSILARNREFAHSARLRLNIGNIYFKQKQYKNSLKMYTMALDNVPPSAIMARSAVLKNIGICQLKLNNFQAALEAFETIMELNSQFVSGSVLYNLFLCRFIIGLDWTDILETLLNLETEFVSNPDKIRGFKITVLTILRKSGVTLDELRSYTKGTDVESRFEHMHALELLKQGRIDDAKRKYQQLGRRNDLAVIALLENEKDRALEMFNDLHKQNKWDKDVLNNLSVMNQHLDSNSEDILGSHFHYLYNYAFKTKNSDIARELLKQCPLCSTLYTLVDEEEVGLALVPTDITLLKAVANNQTDIDQAKHFYAEVIRHKPEDLDAVLWLGKKLLNTKEYTGAAKIFSDCAFVRRRESQWRVMQIKCLLRNNQRKEAIDIVTEAITDFPEDEEIIKLHQKLT